MSKPGEPSQPERSIPEDTKAPAREPLKRSNMVIEERAIEAAAKALAVENGRPASAWREFRRRAWLAITAYERVRSLSRGGPGAHVDDQKAPPR